MKDKNTRCRCLLCDLPTSLGPFKIFWSRKYDHSIRHGPALVCHYRDPTDVMLPQKISLPNNSSLGKRKLHDAFQSDFPKYITLKDLPDSVCYCDIELFYLKDPQRKCDVLCVIIEFRNLKGGWAPFCGRMSMSARHRHVRSAHGTMQSHRSRS